MKILLISVLGILFGFLTANAQCPETAEQALFNMKMADQAGQVSSVQDAYNLTNAAFERCPDRSEVQGLASELLVRIASAVTDKEVKFTLWSKAYAAAVNNHNAFNGGISPTVTFGNGNVRTLYPYATVSNIMANHISQQLLEFALHGQVHPIFNPEPLTACPYNRQQNRVRDEGLGLRHAGARFYHQGGAQLALDRLKRLHTVCDEQKSYLTLLLAELHGASSYYASQANQYDFAVDHAEKSLDYYETFNTMKLNDSSDKDERRGMPSKLKDAKEVLTKAKDRRETYK
ncbi:MAG: hypothetical protein ABNH53_04395 [Henriciella sp.]